MSAIRSASLQRCNFLHLAVKYISFGLFFQLLQVLFVLPYQMVQPGIAKYTLLYFQVRFKTVVIVSF